MAEEDELKKLSMELELGKKKKKKKKIALDVVAAEAASLAAGAGGGVETTVPQPPPSAPQESQVTGATPLGTAEAGLENEDDLQRELMGKKKKKEKED